MRASRSRPIGTPRMGAACEPLESRLTPAATPWPAFDVARPAGAPPLAQLWVDPIAGDDALSGASREASLRTLSEAWRRVPSHVPLASGFQINLTAGTYPESAVPHYWESRHGSRSAPVIITAVDGPGSARLPNLNIYDCRHLYLVGLDVSSGGGDVVHLDGCTNILLKATTIRGLGTIATYAVPQEALKVNQSQHIYVEQCDISGAWDNAVDFVAVQYGHVVGSRIHRSGDWAMYVKGGSAALTVAGNEFYDAGTGGFTAGQGTGFEFMVAPWLRYEAYDITFTDNIIRDTEGAGMGVNGGSNILMARNVLYRVGSRSHVIEVGFGLRSCDGDPAACRTRLAQGGWGTATVGGEEPIPNRDVTIVDNVVLNPDGYRSFWQHLSVAGPRTPSVGSNIPSPARADTNLRIERNTIWNGPAGHPLGIEQAAIAAEILAINAINTVKPVLADPWRGDYTVVFPAMPAPPAVLPPVLPPPTAPRSPPSFVFRAVAAGTVRAVTTITVTFNRPVTGVTRDDFVLRRAGAIVSLAAARITTTDRMTFTISGIRGTNLAAAYTLRLKAVGTGIVDDAGTALAVTKFAAWRMLRTVPARLAAATTR